MESWGKFVNLISGEWIMSACRRGNGGDVILLRSFLVAFFIYTLLLGLKNLIDPDRSFSFDYDDLRRQLIDTSTLFGALFGAVYAALYTRFASQWTYLADLYNRIKEAEVGGGANENSEVIAEWKAAFLEDATELHLATKGLFVSIIHTWGKDPKVQQKFVDYAPGGRARFDALMADVDAAHNRNIKKYISVDRAAKPSTQ